MERWPNAIAAFALAALVSTVTATLRSVSSSALRTRTFSSTCSAMCWAFGNEAETTSTLNSPAGSSASWRCRAAAAGGEHGDDDQDEAAHTAQRTTAR